MPHRVSILHLWNFMPRFFTTYNMSHQNSVRNPYHHVGCTTIVQWKEIREDGSGHQASLFTMFTALLPWSLSLEIMTQTQRSWFLQFVQNILFILQASRYRPSNLVNQTFSYCNAILISFNRSNYRCHYRRSLSINPRLNTGGALCLSQFMNDAC